MTGGLGLYRLVGRIAVPCSDTREWFEAYGLNRQVAETFIGGLRISTVFLAIDHNYSGQGDPLLFETMIFDDGKDGIDATYQTRCSTWGEAEAQHVAAEVVAMAWLAKARAALRSLNPQQRTDTPD